MTLLSTSAADRGHMGKIRASNLTGRKADSIFVPSGCAHGFYVRSERAIVLYNVSTVYAPAHDTGIRWDSVGLNGLRKPDRLRAGCGVVAALGIRHAFLNGACRC